MVPFSQVCLIICCLRYPYILKSTIFIIWSYFSVDKAFKCGFRLTLKYTCVKIKLLDCKNFNGCVFIKAHLLYTCLENMNSSYKILFSFFYFFLTYWNVACIILCNECRMTRIFQRVWQFKVRTLALNQREFYAKLFLQLSLKI